MSALGQALQKQEGFQEEVMLGLSAGLPKHLSLFLRPKVVNLKLLPSLWPAFGQCGFHFLGSSSGKCPSGQGCDPRWRTDDGAIHFHIA